jgi:hypothetical protein
MYSKQGVSPNDRDVLLSYGHQVRVLCLNSLLTNARITGSQTAMRITRMSQNISIFLQGAFRVCYLVMLFVVKLPDIGL